MTLAILVVALALGSPGASPAAGVEGTYRMEAGVHLQAEPLPDDVELKADAVVTSGANPGEIQLRLAAQGEACELTARLDEQGGLVLAPGQKCPVELGDGMIQGKLVAKLRRGRGRIGDGRLSLDLAFDLRGAVRLGPGQTRIERHLTPKVSVEGEGTATASGARDESRGARP
jgi:hypothetical protein